MLPENAHFIKDAARERADDFLSKLRNKYDVRYIAKHRRFIKAVAGLATVGFNEEFIRWFWRYFDEKLNELDKNEKETEK